MKMSNRHRVQRLLGMAFLVASVFLCLPFAAAAEGSKDLCENGGYRPYTERYGLETAGEDRDEIISVYLKAGETVNFGSSVCNAVLGYTNEKLGTNFSAAELAALNATDILVTTPAWDSTANPHSYPYVGGIKDDAVLLFHIDDHATETSQGFIATPAREAAGPGAAAGYTPYTLTATTDGVYRFKFYSAKHNIENPKPVKTTDPWNQKGSCVAAWDTTVRDAAGNTIEGRTFTDALFLNMGNNVANVDVLKACIYAVTDDGYRYKVDFNGMDPYGFVFYANNRGMLQSEVDGFSRSLYHSVMSNNNQLSDLSVHDIILNNIPADAVDHTYHLFYNEPDAAALAALGIGDPDAGGTVTNFKFTGTGDATENEGYFGLGGTFSFDADSSIAASSYQVELKFADDNIVLLSNHLKPGETNSIPWDGRDARGDIVAPGSYGADRVTLRLKGGEVHFPLMDVENNRNGIKISRLNGLNPDNVVYYNNSGSSNIGDTTAPWTAAKNWNVADKKDASAVGVDSSNGAMAYSNRAGDQCALDLWAYYGTKADLGNFQFKIVDTEFTATKEWKGEPEEWAHQPEAVTLQLRADDVDVGDPVTVTAADGWSHTFEELSPADANGNLIRYTVRETATPPYYTVSYGEVTGDVNNGFAQAVTNTATLTSVTVRKVWDNEDDENPPDSVDVQLLADGAQVEACTLTADNAWKYQFADLDPAKAYTVTETDIEGYTGKVSALQGNAELGYTCTVTNTFNESKFTTVGVMKEWQNVPEGQQPAEVTMTLLRSADGGATWEPAKDRDDAEIAPARLNQDNEWLNVWRQLPNEYTYAVSETLAGNRPEEVGYTLTDSEDAPITDSEHIPLQKLGDTKYFYLDVVNTYKPTSFTFTKNWHHGINSNPETQPESITVQLQQRTLDTDFVNYGPAVTLTAAENWQCSWSDLPSFNRDSVRYEYCVTEKELATYRAEPGGVEGSAAEGYAQQIKNTYKFTMLTIEKSWDHGAQPEEEYPTGVRCKLVAPDGSTTATFMLTEANEWKCELHDLPCLDADGNAIDYTAYTVVEGDVIDYEHSGGAVTGDADTGYRAALANTYAPVPTPVPSPTGTPSPTDTPSPTQNPDPTDKPAPTATPAPAPEPTATPAATPAPALTGARTIPATGAGDSPALYMALAAVSGLALVLLTLKKRCRNR